MDARSKHVSSTTFLDDCTMNNGGCGSNAICTHDPTTNAVLCACKAGYTNTGTNSSVVCTGKTLRRNKAARSQYVLHRAYCFRCRHLPSAERRLWCECSLLTRWNKQCGSMYLQDRIHQYWLSALLYLHRWEASVDHLAMSYKQSCSLAFF